MRAAAVPSRQVALQDVDRTQRRCMLKAQCGRWFAIHCGIQQRTVRGRGKCVTCRQSLGSERAAVESLRGEVAKAQQAVRSEQELAERLRREAAAASAKAQRQARPATDPEAGCERA